MQERTKTYKGKSKKNDKEHDTKRETLNSSKSWIRKKMEGRDGKPYENYITGNCFYIHLAVCLCLCLWEEEAASAAVATWLSRSRERE